MPKTVQIRDLDDEVYAALARHAAESGVSVPELLRAEAVRLASRPSVEEWLRRTQRRSSSVDRADILAALDEQRGVSAERVRELIASAPSIDDGFADDVRELRGSVEAPADRGPADRR